LTKLAKSAFMAAILTLAVATAAAQTLTGTVTNGTTGKPAAGDEVILINLANGMDIGGSTKADSAGKFIIKWRLLARTRLTFRSMMWQRRSPSLA